MCLYLKKFGLSLLCFISFLLLGCGNILVQENVSSIEVELNFQKSADPMASMRSVTTSISLSHHVEGWVENQQGKRLQTVEKDFSGSTVLSFDQIEPGTVARVFVRISNKNVVLYSGKSDFFTASRRGNRVPVQLDHGDFPVEDIEDSTVTGGDDFTTGDDTVVGDDETTNTDGNEPTTDDTGTLAPTFDPSWITMTVSSRNATADPVTRQGSKNDVSVTHNFYGITGSQVTFSLSEEARNKGMKGLYVNSGSTTGSESTVFNQGTGTVRYSVQIQSSAGSSNWYYFDVTSKMKPVTVTFNRLEYVYAAASNASAEINIYNFSVAGQTVTTTISKTTNYGTNQTEILQDFSVSTTSMPVTVTSNGGATVTINGKRNELSAQSYSLSDLYGKTSVMWGTYLRLNYTISQ